MNYALEISLYLGCKINCSYCPQPILFQNTDKKKICLAEYKDLIETVPSDVEIGFCGLSEPLLHEEFKDIALYTYHKGHKISCFTTLPSTYIQNIDLFLQEGIWNMRCVHIIDEFMSVKIDKAYLRNLEKYFSIIDKNDRKKNTISIITEQLDARVEALLIEYGIDHLPIYNTPYLRIKAPIPRFASPIIPPRLTGEIYCSHGHEKIQHLLPNGDVVLCCMDIEKQHILGNLNKQSYESLFKGKEYNLVIQGFKEDLNTICRNCIMAKQVTS